jgi:hypothetical protein
MPEGSSSLARLDPFSLPLRFEQKDHAAETRIVELHRERVVLRRTVSGIKMAVNLPVSAYRGVAIRMRPPTPEADASIAVILEHFDPALSLTLCRSSDAGEIVTEWQSWSRTLGVPLLVAQADGSLRELLERIGALALSKPLPRRRRRGALQRRRASMPLRRRTLLAHTAAAVHRGEREIIARN